MGATPGALLSSRTTAERTLSGPSRSYMAMATTTSFCKCSSQSPGSKRAHMCWLKLHQAMVELRDAGGGSDRKRCQVISPILEWSAAAGDGRCHGVFLALYRLSNRSCRNRHIQK